MRLERKSLLACTLLLLTGCSAARQSRTADSESFAPDQVPLPMRHADEYDSGEGNYDYEYETTPSHDDDSLTPRSSLPQSTPMREPVPAPPAIGVSRVKSVSWLDRREPAAAKNTCGDDTHVDGCTTGNVSQFPQSYFTEGCDTAPPTTGPSLQDREKTNLVEVIRGWNLKRRTPSPRPVRGTRNCGEQIVAAPGCYAPGGCAQSFPSQDGVGRPNEYSGPKNYGTRSGSLADPLSENGWDDNNTHRENPGFTPDELMELPSNLEQQPSVQPPAGTNPLPVPHVPDETLIQPEPVLPIPLQAVPDGTIPVPVAPQDNPNSVKTNVKPPLWPRLGQPAPKAENFPVTVPTSEADSSLPLIQPGRRI